MNVFDVDGTLADTAPLVCKAYAEVGISVLPEQLSEHWTDWLLPKCGGNCSAAEIVRSAKTSRYLQILQSVCPRPLPSRDLALEMKRAGEPIRVITAAHPASTNRLLEKLGLASAPCVGYEVAPADRPGILRMLAPHGTYYDDRRETVELVKSETDWTAILV